MPNPIIIKFGGSLLSDAQNLHHLAQIIAGSPQALIVPGGGPFADLVRHYGTLLHLSEETCHFMAISAMDQYGYILREYMPGCRIFSCSPFLAQVPEEELPRSWDITSDSIAAYIAREMNASMLIVLKSIDIGPHLNEALNEPYVDAFFKNLLPLPFPCWFINGNFPERLKNLLATGAACGSVLPPNCPPEGLIKNP